MQTLKALLVAVTLGLGPADNHLEAMSAATRLPSASPAGGFIILNGRPSAFVRV